MDVLGGLSAFFGSALLRRALPVTTSHLNTNVRSRAAITATLHGRPPTITMQVPSRDGLAGGRARAGGLDQSVQEKAYTA